MSKWRVPPKSAALAPPPNMRRFAAYLLLRTLPVAVWLVALFGWALGERVQSLTGHELPWSAFLYGDKVRVRPLCGAQSARCRLPRRGAQALDWENDAQLQQAVQESQPVVLISLVLCLLAMSAGYLQRTEVCTRDAGSPALPSPPHPPPPQSLWHEPPRNLAWGLACLASIGFCAMGVMVLAPVWCVVPPRATAPPHTTTELLRPWRRHAAPSTRMLFPSSLPPQLWLLLALWPLIVVGVDEVVKRHDRVLFERSMRRRRLVFDTRLGMHSPQ